MSVVAMLQGSEPADRAAIQAALSVARRLNVPVQGLCALPDPNAAMLVMSTPEAVGLSASTARAIMDAQENVLKNARQTFEDVTGTGAHGLECRFVHEVQIAEHAGANAATLADAIVFPHSAAKMADPLSLAFEYVLMDARLPVVMAGTADPGTGPVVIAWDGSNGAARAVRFHLPLIQAFGDVVIAQSQKDLGKDQPRSAADPAALEAWLKEHGITSRRADIEGEVASGLLSLARGCDASMIVAGAYGHSRMGERLFGGTTRRLLDAGTSPALALAR